MASPLSTSSQSPSRSTQMMPLAELKIVMVGSVGVGKTSVACRYVKETFRDLLNSTIGASYLWRRDTVDGQEVKLSIWDTCGMEAFHSLVPVYFRDSDGVVLVVDASSDAATSVAEATMWLEKVRRHAPASANVIVVANKSDHPGCSADVVRAASGFAVSNGLQFATVSAKTGEGVREAFCAVASASLRVRRASGLSEVSSRHRTESYFNLRSGKSSVLSAPGDQGESLRKRVCTGGKC